MKIETLFLPAAEALQELAEKVCQDFPNAVLRVDTTLAEEEYCVTFRDGLAIFAAGCNRALLYAVYDYFERAYGVHYFWDGDVYPEQKQALCPMALHEQPRFRWRGIRYFAHRGLHRFQAEMWGEEDWKKEIDYLLKKRYNFFMPRIGMDDLFQKAFPALVPYPPSEGCEDAEKHGFDERSLSWSLQKRASIRKFIHDYARERGLTVPVDCGTMTHWYSRTPHAFLDAVHPTFLFQSTALYGDPTGCVWDIRKEENLENYFRLTDAYVAAYGESALFHTIGLAERLFSNDREQNLALKIEVYQKICARLKARYPAVKLLIASWDFSMYWRPEEVRALLEKLDPTQCIIFDYTADTDDASNNFTHWGVQNHFPYCFGIFHAYEPNNDIRGNYALNNDRISAAADDTSCIGFFTWQELSHGDGLMLEFVARNAWKPAIRPLAESVRLHTAERCGALGDDFCAVYEDVLPAASLQTWGNDREHPYDNVFNDYTWCVVSSAFLRTPLCENPNPAYLIALREKLAAHDSIASHTTSALKKLVALWPKTTTQQQKRTWSDLARTALSREIHFSVIRAALDFFDGRDIQSASARILRLQEQLALLLGCFDDYTLASTVEKIRAVDSVNPYFIKRTLKENVSNEYCRTCIYEVFRYLTIPETALAFRHFMAGTLSSDSFATERNSLLRAFLERDLSEMRPSGPKTPEIFLNNLLKSEFLS